MTRIENMDYAIIGRALLNGELVFVYAENLILDQLANNLRKERPELSDEELDEAANDLLSDIYESSSYLKPQPIIVELKDI